MIDTVGFKVIIDREAYTRLLENAVLTTRIDMQEGDVLFEYNNARVDFRSASWNYNVLFKVTEEYWTYDRERRHPYKASGIPHISFEYSVPKILFGHNMVSVHPSLIYASAHKVKEAFETMYGVSLPCPTEWYCFRIDTCANYVLENEVQVRNYINYLQRLNYPRRFKNSYEDTGLFFASRHNTLKVYCKGEEFKKHDMKNIADGTTAQMLYEEAMKILRVEVEHRKRIAYVVKEYERENTVLLEKFAGYVRLKDLMKIFHFEEEMKRVVSQILCGTETKIMESEAVLQHLMRRFSDKQSRAFHHVYLLIITQGQKWVKQQMPRRSYYRALKAFREVKISLIAKEGNETIGFLDKGVPDDFSLDMSEGNKYYQLPVSDLLNLADEKEEPLEGND